MFNVSGKTQYLMSLLHVSSSFLQVPVLVEVQFLDDEPLARLALVPVRLPELQAEVPVRADQEQERHPDQGQQEGLQSKQVGQQGQVTGVRVRVSLGLEGKV